MNVSAIADVLRDVVYVVLTDPYSTGQPPQLIAYDGATFEVLSETLISQQIPAAFGFSPTLEEGGLKLVLDPVSHHLYLYKDGKFIIVRDAPPSELAIAEDAEVGPVTISSPQVTITFADVNTGGTTTVAPIQPEALNLALSGQFSLSGAGAYEISTTASVSPPYTLCFNASNVTDPAAFGLLVVLHGENGAWVDRTVSRDFSTGTICASTESFSPFAIGRRIPMHYGIRTLYDESRAARAGSTIPIKLQVLDASGLNISSAALRVTARAITLTSTTVSSAATDSGNANPDANFRYDSALAGYVFNLSTKGLSAGTYSVSFDVEGDPSVHTVSFGVRQ